MAKTMDNEQLIQLLDIHAEGLKEDNDLSVYLIQDWLEDESYVEVMGLFRLAKAVRNVLRPLAAPSPVATLVFEDAAHDIDELPVVDPETKNRLILMGTFASLVAGMAYLYWSRARDEENISTAVN